MQGDFDWDIVHNEYYRNDNTPISPITIYPALNSHTIEILVTADSIPKTWFYAGRLYYLIDNPAIYTFPKIGAIINTPINQSRVIVFDKLAENYWLRYHPHRWFLWQSVRIRSYRFGA